MRQLLSTNRGVYVLVLTLSLFFFVLNLLTISWTPIPWIDEIMFIDTSVNYYLDGSWSTKAWYSYGEKLPFSTYPPLYQVLLVPWMYLFGFSQVSCESLNLVIALFFCLYLVKVLIDKKLISSIIPVLVFVLLFWLGYRFSWIYRNCRVDILNATIIVILLTQVLGFVEGRKKNWQIFFSSIMLIASGIQVGVFVVFIFLYCYTFFKGRRKKIFFAALISGSGLFTGFVLLCGFFAYHGRLVDFLIPIVSHSSTLKDLAILMLPIVGPILGMDHERWISKAQGMTENHGSGLLESIFNSYELNSDYLFIVGLCALVFIYLKYKKNEISYQLKVLFGFSLIVPIFMNMAGRYVLYYTWMGFIPAIISLAIYTEKIKEKKIVQPIILTVIVVIACSGLPLKLYQSDRNRQDIVEHFIEKQNIDYDTKVIAPFSLYYQLRKRTSECYLAGIYPFNFLPEDVQLIIVNEGEYGNRINDYMKELKKKNVDLNLIDFNEEYKISVYKVGED